MRIAPEDMKNLIENFSLIMPIDQYRMQSPVKIRSIRHPDRLHSIDGIQHFTWPYRHTGSPQGTCKCQQISDELAITRGLPG